MNPGRLLAAIRGWQRYSSDRRDYRKLMGADSPAWGRELPILTEWNANAGDFGAYFHQDRLVASWIHDAAPVRHIDVGSRIDGFIGSLSVFRRVEVLDIRPQPVAIPNVLFHRVDLMRELATEWKECTDSLSCLHTIEHFGLGRYGDPLDPDGHLKGLAQFKAMVKPGGVLYLSTPIGPERIEFNAHRIFAPVTLLSWFDDGWRIEKCAILDDDNELHEDAGVEELTRFSGNSGLGIVCARRMR